MSVFLGIILVSFVLYMIGLSAYYIHVLSEMPRQATFPKPKPATVASANNLPG